MLNVIELSIVIVIIIVLMLNVIKQSVASLWGIMLNVVMLSSYFEFDSTICD